MDGPQTPNTKTRAKKSQKYAVSSSLGNLKVKDGKKGLQGSSVSFVDGDGTRLDMSLDSATGTGKARLMKNYFGLPIYATQQSPLAIVYQSRGAVVTAPSEKSVAPTVHETDSDAVVGRVDNTTVSTANQVAQRKVAASLLSMANTESMTNYFLHKGGVEAVTRLIFESGDSDVLYICATALHQAATKEENCGVLISKQIVSSLLKLIEIGDAQIRLHCARTMTCLSMVQGPAEEQLVMSNALSVVQAMLATAGSNAEHVSLAMLCLSNIAPSLAGNNDVEVAVRTSIQVSKRLEVLKNHPAALFIMRIFANLSYLPAFISIMCEESVTPLLLHVIEAHPQQEIVGYASETFLNLSLVRKNRREIAASGLAGQLQRMFTIGDANARARALTTVGNLLNSNQFYDKMANKDIIDTILNVLFVLNQPRQFCAVAYCLSQLASNRVCAEILVECDVVKKTIEPLVEAPMEATCYMWNVLVSLSLQRSFFGHIIREKAVLFPALLSEAQKHSGHPNLLEPIAWLAHNIALAPDLPLHIDTAQAELLVRTLKHVIEVYPPMKLTMLTGLVYVAAAMPASRPAVLQDDVIKLLSRGGDGGIQMNINCAALLNLVSCDEKCCQPLLDAGAQQFLVTIHAQLMTAHSHASKADALRAASRGTDRASTALSNNAESENNTNLATVSSAALTSLMQPGGAASVEALELGQDLIASTLHNLSLKRPVLGAGVLALLLALMRNTKNERVLYCVRTLANISTQSKAKHVLAKERKLVPILTAIMRCGCKFADKVQQYCAIVICNVLATKVDRGTMEEIIKNGTIVDLRVVTLLRVNRVNGDRTKEALARALFNLMSASEFRETMVVDLDVFSATLDLARIESLDLLEICVRAVFNISCQFPNSGGAYSKITHKFSALKVPSLMIGRATSSPSLPGCRASSAIKFLCGMALANMSFIPELAVDLTEDRVSNAAFTVMSLDSDEATYCVAVLLFNLSQHRNCVTMADQQAVPLLTSIVGRGPLLCSQLAMSALCNLSLLEAFHHQLTNAALPAIVQAMGAPQTEMSIRSDARRCVYNLVTRYPASRPQAVLCDCSSALMSLVKAQSEDAVLVSIGRIVKELCSEAGDEAVHRKLMQDNIMPLLLRLSKLEIPELKHDISCAVFALTTVTDTLRVLKWDSVDILFWLTLHDCLGLQDAILRNVGRALRNFTATTAEARYIVKEERFLGVLKVLSRSSHEDVLWQSAGVCYNVLHVPECRKAFLARGAMSLIFELAASNFTSVRHVCSACVHMVPEAMPDMEDPLVLQLILCLLDADGEKHAELGERCLVALPYDVPALSERSPFVHLETNFKPTWVTLTTTTDTLFSPVAYPAQPSKPRGMENVKPFDTNSICNSVGFVKLTAAEFNNFEEPAAAAALSTRSDWDGDDDDEDNRVDSPPHGLATGPSVKGGDLSRQVSKRARRPSSKNIRPPSRSRSGSVLLDDKKPSSRSLTSRDTATNQGALPKLSDVKRIPDDTLSAIKGSFGSHSYKPKQESTTIFTAPKLK